MGLLETELFHQGFDLIAGVDEVGRGPLAGPVVAACVILDKAWKNPGVADSKALSAAKREHLAEQIKKTASAWAIAECSVQEVERLNIHHASLLAMKRAVSSLEIKPGFLLIDGRHTIDSEIPQRPVVKGDATCNSVACASILAKTHRDEFMRQVHDKYPAYNFASNKGYPTAEHRKALQEVGPCPLHRRTYGPVAQFSLDFGDNQNSQAPLGSEAETLAAGYLKQMGFTIIEANSRNKGGEIDIIANDGQILVFVEVKARSGKLFGSPVEAVDIRKQKRLIRAAQAYLADAPSSRMQRDAAGSLTSDKASCGALGPRINEQRTLPVCRFDVIGVDYSGDAPRIEHIPDAFRMEE